MKTRGVKPIGRPKKKNARFGNEELDPKAELERQKRRENMQKKRANPAYRELERAKNSAARRLARQDPAFRERERIRNSAARRRARDNPEYRARERARNSEAIRRRREDPEFRERERRRDSGNRRSRRLRRTKSKTEEKSIVELKDFLEVCLSEETTLTFI